MAWQNQNTSKKVYTIARPLEEEDLLMQSIPEDAIITAIERNTKTVRVTYVIENKLTIQDLILSNQENVEPIKFNRKKKTKKSSNTKTIERGPKCLALLNIADFHLNRRVFANETYGHDYDIQIASQVWKEIIDRACKEIRSSSYSIDKIILNTAGDFVNSDTKYGTTTAGTPQFNDVSWKQVFNVATSLLEYAITQLSKIAHVEYFYVAGNHDELVGYYLTSWLDARFANFKSVHIKTNPCQRQIVKYGSNLFCFTHGDSEGGRTMTLPFVEPMAVKELSSTTNIEVISAHMHKNNVQTHFNVRWETLSSACPVQDEWSYEKGFDSQRAEATIMFYDDAYRRQQNTINVNQILDCVEYEKDGK